MAERITSGIVERIKILGEFLHNMSIVTIFVSYVHLIGNKLLKLKSCYFKIIDGFWTKWQLWPKNVKIQIIQILNFFISTLGADGVDLMQGEGCGIRNLRCNDQTSIHLNLLEMIRKKLPKGMMQIWKFYISYVRIHFLVGLRIF